MCCWVSACNFLIIKFSDCYSNLVTMFTDYQHLVYIHVHVCVLLLYALMALMPLTRCLNLKQSNDEESTQCTSKPCSEKV